MSSIGDFVDAAGSAAASAPSSTLDLRPAGLTLRVRLAGEQVVERLAPGLLASPAEPGQTPVATIHSFDTATAGVRPPAPPWTLDAFQTGRETVAGFTEPPRLATYDQDHATLAYFDEDAAAGVQWFRDARAMHAGEPGAPMRNLIRWALAPHDQHFLHMAAVGGALICGPSGAGKSTTALAGMLAGLDYTADDFTLVTFEGRPAAHAVYAYGRATDQTLELLPELKPLAAGGDWRGKQRIDVASRITRSQPVRAIVILERADVTGAPRELDRATALRRLATGNLTMMPGATSRALAALARLVEELPAYSLAVGPDIEAVPEAVALAADARISA